MDPNWLRANPPNPIVTETVALNRLRADPPNLIVTDAPEPVVTETAPVIRRYALSFALDGWRSPGGTAGPVQRFEAAQGVVLALLRHADPVAATALHDANERKALSISPVTIQVLPGGLARAELTLAAWQPDLVRLLDAALAGATDARLRLGTVPALLLAGNPIGEWRHDDGPATPAPDLVRVRFASPTLFGFGRHPNGRARTHLVPDPGPVVASWLRAWRLTGDQSLDWLPASPEALGESVALTELRDIRTVAVPERTVSLTGFLGEAAYRWQGREVEGRRALATLARFAGICGTGAKTGRGFGQTVPLVPRLDDDPTEGSGAAS